MDLSSISAITDNTPPLNALIKRKLKGVPPRLLPEIDITDVVEKDNVNTKFTHIPPDLDLGTLFQYRQAIDDAALIPLKTGQDITVTRLIWYYQMSPVRSFSTRRSRMKWMVVAFITALGSGNPQNFQGGMEAAEFMAAWLRAWQEDLRTPEKFEQRDTFIELWRRSKFDLPMFAEAQQGACKRAMRALRVNLAAKEAGMGGEVPGLGLDAIKHLVTEVNEALKDDKKGAKTGLTDHPARSMYQWGTNIEDYTGPTRTLHWLAQPISKYVEVDHSHCPPQGISPLTDAEFFPVIKSPQACDPDTLAKAMEMFLNIH